MRSIRDLTLAAAAAGALAFAGAPMPASGAAAVTNIELRVPAHAGQAERRYELTRYTVDSVANFSLVLPASARTRTGDTVVVADVAAGTVLPFATAGPASRFAQMTIVKWGPATSPHTTTLYGVAVVRIVSQKGDAATTQRITLIAHRIAG